MTRLNERASDEELVMSECSFLGCGRDKKKLGLCGGHYTQQSRGTPLAPLRAYAPPGPCSFDGCDRIRLAKGLCRGHYGQQHSGKSLTPLRAKRPRMDIEVRDPSGRKQCSGCKLWLAEDRYYSSSETPDGLQAMCKDCRRASKYGLSGAQYTRMLARQCGLCATCLRVMSTPHIDHDHACCSRQGGSCGECVRGLLCGNCNTGIGLLDEDPNALGRVSAYLKFHNRTGVAA